MAIVTPVFNLNGQCEEAIELYKKAFNAKVNILLRYSDADPLDFNILPLTDIQKNMIYHAVIYIGEQRLILSDIVEFDLVAGTALSLLITYNTADEVKKAYEILKDGASIIYPLKSTTYSSCFVSLIDKFGFRWGIMTETPDNNF